MCGKQRESAAAACVDAPFVGLCATLRFALSTSGVRRKPAYWVPGTPKVPKRISRLPSRERDVRSRGCFGDWCACVCGARSPRSSLVSPTRWPSEKGSRGHPSVLRVAAAGPHSEGKEEREKVAEGRPVSIEEGEAVTEAGNAAQKLRAHAPAHPHPPHGPHHRRCGDVP